jgi:hypothetical protein
MPSRAWEDFCKPGFRDNEKKYDYSMFQAGLKRTQVTGRDQKFWEYG